MVIELDRGEAAGLAAVQATARRLEHALPRLGGDGGPHVRRRPDWLRQTVATLLRAVECRDPGTAAHARRVTRLALRLADAVGLAGRDRAVLEVGALLHDVGKIAVSDAVLRKPAGLTADELAQMRAHPLEGVRLLEGLVALAPALPIVRSHHERWDGGGYPDGLCGSAIPRLARIVAIADAFDAMTADRPYRPALPAAVALGRIAAGAGSQFDPDLAAAFLRYRRGRACACA